MFTIMRKGQLAHKKMGMQHEHHDICISTMQVHLDHDNCLETLILKGPFKLVSTFANQLRAMRGSTAVTNIGMQLACFPMH